MAINYLNASRGYSHSLELTRDCQNELDWHDKRKEGLSAGGTWTLPSKFEAGWVFFSSTENYDYVDDYDITYSSEILEELQGVKRLLNLLEGTK